MTLRRPTVLVIIGHYWPGYKSGGPIRTIRNLVTALSDEFDFRIITSNHDFRTLERYSSVITDDWNRVEDAQVFYAATKTLQARRFADLIASVDADVVYANSFFSPRFAVVPLVMRRFSRRSHPAPWIVAPRGEFSRGAMAIKSCRKRAFVFAASIARLHRDVIWQASSVHEATDIERVLGVSHKAIHVAPNLTASVENVPLTPRLPRQDTRLSVCFLGRICVMKNLMFVLEVLAKCRCSVDLHIYGPIESEGYANHCRNLIRLCDARLTVSWHGEVPHENVRSVLSAHDLFFLPTMGENFGHGIIEALAAGVPVLVSDRTPWRDLETVGVGWALSLDDQASFVAAVEDLATMPWENRLEMRRRAHSYAAKVAASSEARDANRRLFRFALEQAAG